MEQNELIRVLHESVAISDYFSQNLEVTAQLDTRNRLATAYLSMALEHREALLLLVHNGAHASATVLQRPLLEAFVTGAWFFASASDSEIEAISRMKRPPPKFETMAQSLRKTHDLGEWFEHFRKHYEILGDYAHGHQRQLSRWLGPGAIEPRYDQHQMIEVLIHTDVIGVMAAIHREKIADQPIDNLLKILERRLEKSKVSQVKSVAATD